MAVHGEHRLAGVRDALDQRPDQLGELVRHRVADGVGDVDRRRAGGDRRLKHAAQEVRIAAARVLRRELDVVGEVARALDRRDGGVQDRLGGHIELLLHMDRRGRDEGVYPSARRLGDRGAGGVDVGILGARQAADDAALDRGGDLGDGVEVALARRGEARLDDVDLHLLELPRDAQLLLGVHGRTDALLAVAKRGVKNQQPVCCAPRLRGALLFLAHGKSPFSSLFGLTVGVVIALWGG